MPHIPLGPIVKCQVSARPLIHDGRYVASDIIRADELHLSPAGAVGWCDDRAVLNHHHRLNPRRTKWRANRLLSIGFTSHYRAMSDRFGPLELGCGAENVIVECDRIITEADLAGGIRIRTSDGDLIVDLAPAAVAKPCVPFTKYLLGDDGADETEVVPNRDFLDNGMRGFVLGLADLDPDAEPVRIGPGDQLWLAEGPV